MSSLAGRKIRIALAGGGTGGHIYPLVAVAEALKDQAAAAGIHLQLHYYGANDRFRPEIEAQGIRFHSLLTGKLRRYVSVMNLIDVPKIFLGTIQALFKLYALMPDVIFSKGGPGAFPVVIAGWFYKIPVVIHESDSVPGLTTLLTARFARKIALSFNTAAPYFNSTKVVEAGNPIRKDLFSGRLPQDEAKRKLGFDPAKLLLFVTGGSQGAAKINEFVILNMGSLLPLAQILHQTGPANFVEAKQLAEAQLVQLPTAASTESRYQSLAYLSLEQTRDALAAADIILARAGASSIFEAAAFGKPMILIPLSSAARDHQRENAQVFAKAGAAIVIEESNLHANIFMAEFQGVLANPALLQSMGAASAAFSKPDAAKEIAATIFGLA